MGKIWCDLRAFLFQNRQSRRSHQIVKIWCALRALPFQKRQSRRSHQIFSSEFGKDGWAKSVVICAPCFIRKDIRADDTRVVGPVNLRRMHGQNLVWLFGNGQPHRSHQILSGQFGKNAWGAKYGVICAARLAFQKRQPRRSHQIRNNFAIAKQTKLLLSQQGACSSRPASSGAIRLQLHENKFARIWTNLAKNCAKNTEVSRIRTNFARYHTRSGPLTATVARFCDVCRPPM